MRMLSWDFMVRWVIAKIHTIDSLEMTNNWKNFRKLNSLLALNSNLLMMIWMKFHTIKPNKTKFKRLIKSSFHCLNKNCRISLQVSKKMPKFSLKNMRLTIQKWSRKTERRFLEEWKLLTRINLMVFTNSSMGFSQTTRNQLSWSKSNRPKLMQLINWLKMPLEVELNAGTSFI